MSEQHKGFMLVLALATALATTFVTAVWWGGGAWQRLVALEGLVDAVYSDRFLEQDGDRLRTEMQHQIDKVRDEARHHQRANRAFLRALCFAVTNLQKEQGVPLTDDCARP